MSKGTVLITGAAGFVGSYLVEEFIQKGYSVIGVDNLFRGRMDNLESVKNNEKFSFHLIDLAKDGAPAELKNLLIEHDVQAVFHLAAINGTEYFYDSSYMVLDVNLRTIQTVATAVEGTKVNYLAYTSSSEVYGEPMQVPTPETHPILLNAFANRDSYASSKAMGDYYFRLMAEKLNIKSLILRVFNMYGPRMVGTKYGQVIGEFARRALHDKEFTIIGDGRHTRSFCFVPDAAQMIVKLYERGHNGILNLGNEHEITILELAKLIHKKINRPFAPVFLPERPHDHKRRCPDISLLRTLLPDFILTDLDKGLDATIKSYENNEEARDLNLVSKAV